MSNITTLVPTKNLEKWKIDEIELIIRKEFPNFIIQKDITSLSLNISENNETITTVYFNMDYFIDYDNNIEELKEIGRYDLVSKLNELKSLHPNLDKCVELTYGIGKHLNDKFRIEKIISNYFTAFIFDEGIDPEFIPPFEPKIIKKKRTFLRKCKIFFKKIWKM